MLLRRIALSSAGFAAMLTCVSAGPSASDIDPSVRSVLARSLHFSPTELNDLERNRIVKHTIETTALGEVAVAGAARIDAPKAVFLARVRDIERFKRGPEVLQIGRFSQPPTSNDLAPLTVERDDFDARTCHVGDCGVRLPADTIRRFEREIDPRASDVQQKTAALFKQTLLDEVVAYETGGPGRIESYDDGPRPIRPVEEFKGILAAEPALGALVPGLPLHLRDYPSSRLDGAEDFLYWSKEKFGSEPFSSVTHVTIVCESTRTCIVATRDVYSSRYVDASLAVSVATDSLTDPNHFYLIYTNRSRASAMKGALGAVRRAIVGRRARGSLEDSLKRIKAQLESKR